MKNKKFKKDNNDDDKNNNKKNKDNKKNKEENDLDQLENIIENTESQKFKKMDLEEIIPVLKERSVQTVNQIVRNIQTDEENEEQTKVYQLKIKNGPEEPSKTNSNYELNNQYSSIQSESYDSQQMQKTSETSPVSMDVRRDNSFISVMGSQLTPTNQTQNQNISYETDIEKKQRERKKMW